MFGHGQETKEPPVGAAGVTVTTQKDGTPESSELLLLIPPGTQKGDSSTPIETVNTEASIPSKKLEI